MLNANLACLNDRPLDRDLAAALGRPVRLANDGKCFVLSEAIDGAARRRPPTSIGRAPTSCSARRWARAWAAASSSTGAC